MGSDIRAALQLDSVADPAAATRARRDFTAWLGIDVIGEQGEDIILAVYEALANAAEHAYAEHPDAGGSMSLTAHRGPTQVHVTVADRGHWRIETGDPLRSRGLLLMRQLMTHVALTSDQHGTVVHLHARVPSTPERRPVMGT